jgi:hypothetical protein
MLCSKRLKSLRSFNFGKEAYYFRGQFFTQNGDCRKIHPVNLRSQDYYNYYLNIESQDDFDDDSMALFRDKGYRREFYGVNGDETNKLFLIRFLEREGTHDETEYPKKLMVLSQHKVPTERCDDTKIISQKIVMNKDKKPHSNWLEDIKNTTCAYLHGKLFFHNRQKDYLVIDVETATVIGEGKSDMVIQGIDTLRGLAAGVNEDYQTLQYWPIDLRTDYEAFDIISKKAPQSVDMAKKLKLVTMDDSYDEDLEQLPTESKEAPKKEVGFRLQGVVTSLFRLVFSRKQYSMESATDFQKLDSRQVLKEENKFELCFETFVLIYDLIDSLKGLENKEESKAIALMLLKILDIHLEIAMALQKKDKDSIKFVNQEYLTKLRKQVEVLEFNLPNLTWELQVFDRLKLKVLFQLINMTRTIKKLSCLPWLISQLTSEHKLVPLQAFDFYVGELLSLPSKGLTADLSSSVSNLILDSFFLASEQQLSKEKDVFRYLWDRNKGDKDEGLIGCARTHLLLICSTACRHGMQ